MPSAPAEGYLPGHDAGGFEVFYLATAARTFKVACRLAGGDSHVASDATQEGYLAMWRCWATRSQKSLEHNRRYVLGIVANKTVDWYRTRDNHCAELEEFDGQVTETTPVDRLGEKALLGAVRDLLEGQPARRRAVGVLYFLEEWEHAEIASALGMAESTVRTHLLRLRARLIPLIHRMNDLDQGGDQR